MESHANENQRLSMMAQFIGAPEVKMEEVAEVILHHLTMNFDDRKFNLGHLIPTNKMVASL